MADMQQPLYRGSGEKVRLVKMTALEAGVDSGENLLETDSKFVIVNGNHLIVDKSSPYADPLYRFRISPDGGLHEYAVDSYISSIADGSCKILDAKGIFLVDYPLPNIVVTETTEEFNSHRLSHAPGWVRSYENDAGAVILRDDFFDPDWLEPVDKSKNLAHEILHGMHDLAVMRSFINVTDKEMQRFKREFIKGKRHIGLVEGLMEQLSRGEPNWELVFYMMNYAGIYDLPSLKKQMYLEEGDTPYNKSYVSSHALVNGITNFISDNKRNFIEALKEKGIELHKQSSDYGKVSSEAILFRIVVEYMIQMFDLFRNGGSAVDFEDFFTEITGIEFSNVEKFAWDKLIENGKRRGFERINKVNS
ncbi:hypothetical protein COZ40_00100 [Candidatus Roizmanbacteria bacterium CG_4_10_14_3_um_filter_39_13]|uniref:Uncharacterized protein n=1 Tax=Candidatus Roizmanbacteria bacterium CG_4_10_14_3_um_filter_39_13 TaxID=1974831 RepID=A0A2M7LLT9_9BACT|nr:MAG: hypothetical protein COZ40_00100 [Candidatus Roizmanbacteria bacterium CG_4_10_14_3_um_filter_39_13]